MAGKRRSIPAPLLREVLVEAEHRCAIPACRRIPVQVHHIVPYKTAKEHAFENLIALCAEDRRRAEEGQIKKRSLRTHKANLGLLASRYGELERRVIGMFVDDEHLEFVLVPTELEISMSYLLRDGIVEMRVPTNEASVLRVPSFREYWLTELGEEVIVRFAEGRLVG